MSLNTWIKYISTKACLVLALACFSCAQSPTLQNDSETVFLMQEAQDRVWRLRELMPQAVSLPLGDCGAMHGYVCSTDASVVIDELANSPYFEEYLRITVLTRAIRLNNYVNDPRLVFALLDALMRRALMTGKPSNNLREALWSGWSREYGDQFPMLFSRARQHVEADIARSWRRRRSG